MSPLVWGGLGAACGLAVAYAAAWERWWIEVTRRDLPLCGLPPELDGLDIAHLTDLHYGPYTPARFVRRAVDRANALGAGVVVLTGDFVNWQASEVEPVARELGRLRAPLGVWAVLGGHDVRAGERLCRRLFAENGIRLLRNEAAPLVEGARPLWIAGVRDNSEYSMDDLDAALAPVPEEAHVLLLAHSPDIALEACEHGVGLVLSGHTHGGQICAPFYGPILTESRFGRRFARGLNRIGGTWVYTNRGLGTVRFGARFLARPEIAVHRLVRAEESATVPVSEATPLAAEHALMRNGGRRRPKARVQA